MQIPNSLVVLSLLLAIGLLFSCAPTASAQAPNAAPETIILISLDTTRADHLSCYGYEQETTPNIDALAKESLFFEHPFAPVPMTLPSHCSMFTGLIPPATGVHGNISTYLPPSALTLPEILRQHGFTTYGIVSTSVLKKDRGLSQGFDHYDDSMPDRSANPLDDTTLSERNGRETTTRALQWLSDNAPKKKFMFIHYFDPHDDYKPPAPFDKQFKDPYDGEIAFTDHCVGQILDRLKALDLYDDALIAVVGDHGEMLGEHGEATHSYFIYHNVLRVPMMFKPPGGVPSRRVKEACSLIDVAPTLLSMAGLSVPEEMQGVDLSGYLQPAFTLPNRSIYNESLTPTTFNCSSLLGLVMGRWHYIQTSRPELYDRLKDPAEVDNLIAQNPDQASKMKEELERVITESQNLNTADTNAEMDVETIEQLESLGYVDGNVVVDFSFDDEDKLDAKDMLGVRNRLLAISKMARAGKVELALKACTEIKREHPDVKAAYEYLVSIHTRSGNLAEAAVALEQIRTRFPKTSASLMRLAKIYRRLKEYDKAIVVLNEAISVDPDDGRSYELRAAIHKTQGSFDKALAALERRRAVVSDDAQTLVTQGDIFVKLDDAPNALNSYLGALALEPKFETALIGAARIYLKMGSQSQALSYFEQAVNEGTKLTDAPMMAARLRLSKKNPQLYYPPVALEHAKRAMQLCEDKNVGQCDDLAIFEVLAVAWAANGNFDEAIGVTSRTMELCESKGLSSQAGRMKRRIEKYMRQKQERK